MVVFLLSRYFSEEYDVISLSSWWAAFLVNLHNFLNMLLSSNRKYIFVHDFSAAMLLNGASKRCVIVHNVKAGSKGNIIDHH